MKKFKTNVKCGACVAAITPEMNKLENADWKVDLSHPDRIMAVEGDATPKQVIEALEKAGYKAEEI